MANINLDRSKDPKIAAKAKDWREKILAEIIKKGIKELECIPDDNMVKAVDRRVKLRIDIY